jgi:hypothetical protein
MPKYGAVILGDLNDNGEQFLVVLCEPCQRTGRYSVTRLIDQHGADSGLPDLLGFLTRSCDQPSAPGARRCDAVYQQKPYDFCASRSSAIVVGSS